MKKILKKLLRYDVYYDAIRKSFLYASWKKLSGWLANVMYGSPSKGFFVIGVTWTNGKTTTVNILHHIFSALGIKAVMISTATIKIGNRHMLNEKKMSSLDVFDLQSILAVAKAEWCKVAILEVTSIGLEQSRFEWVEFDVAVLTNITEDHLDYHKTMDNYANAKKKLFSYVLKNHKDSAFAVFPKDDSYGRQWAESMTFDKKITYGVYSSATLKAVDVQEKVTGTDFGVQYLGEKYQFHSPLLGVFNVQNILAALSVCVDMGMEMKNLIDPIATFEWVPGRMDIVEHKGVRYYIDFAHSPDAIEKTLSYLHAVKAHGRLLVVFGAPGNRDRTKRPKMWVIADRYADVLIATDDDPDTENRYQVLDELTMHIPRTIWDTFAIIPDRRLALEAVVDIAHAWDIVIICGKWHEMVQWTNLWHRPRNDKKILEDILRTR
jgi:UDP-N-acetylmuramoyl-L-alanyl-D-glutamate--2,6-diaminopimelate ligase